MTQVFHDTHHTGWLGCKLKRRCVKIGAVATERTSTAASQGTSLGPNGIWSCGKKLKLFFSLLHPGSSHYDMEGMIPLSLSSLSRDGRAELSCLINAGTLISGGPQLEVKLRTADKFSTPPTLLDQNLQLHIFHPCFQTLQTTKQL